MGHYSRGALLSSATDDWSTPLAFFNKLNNEFKFRLDACANRNNAKCDAYYTIAEDGLKQPWFGPVWLNPPYGHQIKQWVEKAYNSALDGITVVALLPARTDTRWWCNYVVKAYEGNVAEIRFVKGRLTFGNAEMQAPFPSAVVVFGLGRSGVSWIDR